MKNDYITLKELSLSTLILGAPGSGKTVLLTHFINAACKRKLPLIFIDAKGDLELAQAMKTLADKSGRKFKLFTFDYHKLEDGGSQAIKHGNLAQSICGYSPFNSKHSHTEQLNRIIKLFANADTSNNAGAVYYSTAWQNVLNSILRTLKKLNEQVDFVLLARILNNLQGFVDKVVTDEQDKAVLLAAADPKKAKEIDGLRNMITILAQSAYGELFDTQKPREMINIESSVANDDVVLFLLNIANYAEDTKRVAQMLISDINATFSDNPGVKKAFLICDEFGSYASQALADSVERGRSAGLMSILATQGLESARHTNEQLINSIITSCSNFFTLSIKNPVDIEMMANIMGTRKTSAITNQIDYETGTTGKGSIRRVDEYAVNPQKIRELQALQAWVYRTQPRQQPYKLQISVLDELRKG